LPSTEHSLALDANAVAAAAQTDLDSMNIPKTAREEMARLYRQHVLGEKPTVQIQPLRRHQKAQKA
jgi:hypothetical protein